MQRNLSFAVDEYYHIYNRGTEKREIFLEPRDYERFLVLLHLTNNTETIHISNLLGEQNQRGRSLMGLLKIQVPERLVSLGVYCLMPNHFHLLVRERVENGVSLFTKKLLTGYSMFFNKKYERNGTLFQGRFKSRHADSDRYLNYLFAYIHLNPLKLNFPEWKTKISRSVLDKKMEFLKKYPYSSFAEFTTNQERPQRIILDKAAFPDYFATKQDASDQLVSWLTELDSEE